MKIRLAISKAENTAWSSGPAFIFFGMPAGSIRDAGWTACWSVCLGAAAQCHRSPERPEEAREHVWGWRHLPAAWAALAALLRFH